MEWLIVYSYYNDDVPNAALKAKTFKFHYIHQIGHNKKNELFQHKISHTQYLRRASWHWWKKAKIISLGIFLSTTESYIITNILKTINLEER